MADEIENGVGREPLRSLGATGGGRLDAVIVGGGVIGLACAWRAASRGLEVCVVERSEPGAAASWVAAGMLAPVGEVSWGEERLLSLNLASARLYPEFSAELERASGLPVPYRRCGALHVALDRDEGEELRRWYELHRSLGLDSEWLLPSECRRLEPGLSPHVGPGLHAREEAEIDPRALMAALAAACERAGTRIVEGTQVTELVRDRSGARGVRTSSGEEIAASTVVVATGSWSGAAEWLPAALRPPVRPVKGEVVRLRAPASDPICDRIVGGERAYVVPRESGEVVIGATVEERGFDVTVTAGGVHELLREAYRTLPEVAELELVEATAGLRPGTPDNAPIVGPSELEGLVLATGHYRNGILQAPITADAVAALLAGEPELEVARGFGPERFAGATAGAGAP